MPLVRTTAPAAEPVTLAEAKMHLRVIDSSEDSLISMLIASARQHAETITRRALVTQSWKLTLDQFPTPGANISSANWYGPQWSNMPGPLSVVRPDGKTGYEIYLPLPPLQTVDSIKYIDTDGVQQTLSAAQYIVDTVSEPARVTPAYGVTWPSTRNQINAVEVVFTCGFGALTEVPEAIKNWMLIRIGSLYENREEVALMNRGKLEPLPFVDGLLDPYRVVTY